MKKIILIATTALFVTACTTQNDVAIQTAWGFDSLQVG